MRCQSFVRGGFPRSCRSPARMSSSSAPSSRKTAAVRSAWRVSPSRATTKRTVCWTRSRTSADEEPGEGERRREDQRAQHSGGKQQNEEQEERTVLLIRAPGVLLPWRQETVDDVRSVKWWDRDEVEDREDAVTKHDRG